VCLHLLVVPAVQIVSVVRSRNDLIVLAAHFETIVAADLEFQTGQNKRGGNVIGGSSQEKPT
jgi:hypothetical protein